MSFDTGVPPPRSKYHSCKFTLENLDIGGGAHHSNSNNVTNTFDNFDDDNCEEDEDDWFVSSGYDEEASQTTSDRNNDDGHDSQPKQQQQAKIQQYNVQQWLEEIETRYFDGRDDLVRQAVQAALEDVSEPFTFVLHVIHCAFFDLYSKRLPITFLTLDEFEIWLELKVTQGEHLPEPYENHKIQAVEIVCRSGYNYLDKICKIFQLDRGDNSYLSQYIRLDDEKMKGKKLKQTVVIIQTLKLQHYFPTIDVMLPLLACDQIQLLETYVGDDTYLQKEYASFLSNLCASEEDTVVETVRNQGIAVKDPSKLHHKTIIKMAEKVVKKYNLDPDDFPDVFNAKNIAGLCYLVRQKCKEERNSATNASYCQKWDQLIETAVSGKPLLQIKLVEKLADFGNINEACKYTRKYFLSPHDLPDDVADEMADYVSNYKEAEITRFSDSDQKVDNENDNSQESWDEECDNSVTFSLSTGFVTNKGTWGDEDDTDQYYQLKLPRENIQLVDTIKSLESVTKDLFMNAKIIGFDAEWKPIVCRAGEQDRISILQLAVEEQIYIIDLFTLYVMPNAEEALKQFFNIFFTSKHIVKIGYGIVGDLKILIGMFSYMKDLVKNAVKLVDLAEVSLPVTNHPLVLPFLYPAKSAALMERGLSLLVNKTLGKRLNKTFQISDWERRPLNPDQLHYAALDAFCLLEVYDFLEDVLKKTKIKANMTVNVKMKWLKTNTQSNRRKDKFEKRQDKELLPENKPLYKGPPRPSTALKVVCDTMLQGLGKYLRACGVDAILLDNNQSHSSIINLSLKEKRVILTRGKPFLMLRGYVPDGMCMMVPDGTLKEQLKMIFTRYNIALKSKDILCRCTACNSNKYMEVKPSDMQLAFELKHDVGDPEMPEDQQTPSGQINLCNFTLNNGVELQLDFVPPFKYEQGLKDNKNMFNNIKLFYVCESCGKVYWEGSHHTAVKINFQELIDKRETDSNYYGVPG